MKKGFTLIEIIGVIVLLALIMILAFPTITSLITSTQNKISDATLKLINVAADNYLENENSFITAGREYCITLSDLTEGGFLSTPLKDVVTGEDIDLSQQVLVEITEVNDTLKREYSLVRDCN